MYFIDIGERIPSYSCYRLQNSPVASTAFDTIYLLANIDSSSYNSSQTHTSYLYIILDFLYRIVTCNNSMIENVKEVY